MIRMLIFLYILLGAPTYARGIDVLKKGNPTPAVQLNPHRLVQMRGQISGIGMNWANRILELAPTKTETHEPIDIFINSPGGNVLVGLQILTAMDIARHRGYRIRCAVGVLAASMAFVILANCDERYALRYAALLWHPIRVGISGRLTPEVADKILYDLKRFERPLNERVRRVLRVTDEVWKYHRRNETLHLAEDLTEMDSEFVTVVPDIGGIDKPFELRSR